MNEDITYCQHVLSKEKIFCRIFFLAWSKIRQKRSEEHTSELQSHSDLVCRLLLEKKTVPDLLSGSERNRQEEISEMMNDPFIAEMMPFVQHPTEMQMTNLLTQIRDLTLRPRRTA